MKKGDTVNCVNDVVLYCEGSIITRWAGLPMTLLYEVSGTWRVEHDGHIGFAPERLLKVVGQ